MRNFILMAALAFFAAGTVQAQDTICGVAFITSATSSSPLDHCTVTGSAAGGPFEWVFEDVASGQRIELQERLALLTLPIEYHVTCTDSGELTSEEADPYGSCFLPSRPRIVLD